VLSLRRVTILCALAAVQSPSSPSCKWVPALFRDRESKETRERRRIPPSRYWPLKEAEVSDISLSNGYSPITLLVLESGVGVTLVQFLALFLHAAPRGCDDWHPEEGGDWRGHAHPEKEGVVIDVLIESILFSEGEGISITIDFFLFYIQPSITAQLVNANQ